MKKQIIKTKLDNVRICSMHNDMWQVEQTAGPSNREHSGWKALHRPTDLPEAQRQVRVHEFTAGYR